MIAKIAEYLLVFIIFAVLWTSLAVAQ